MMMLLSYILREMPRHIQTLNRKKKINHLMYMDDIKLFAKNEKELGTLIQTVRIYSLDIGMDFGIEKYAFLIMKSGKQQMIDVIELLNHGKIRTLGEKEYWKRTPLNMRKWKEKKNPGERTNIETKLHSRNLIKEINTWSVPLRKNIGTIFKIMWEELQRVGQETRKLMTMH